MRVWYNTGSRSGYPSICACALFAIKMLAVTLLVAALHLIGFCTANEGSCNAEGMVACQDRAHSIMNNTRWQSYVDQIAESLDGYAGCSGNRCDCHGDVINNDLRVWKERGVEWAEFQAAKKVGGVHYQIIENQIYRQEHCMFNTRCRGIEHFLLEIVEGLPNMEMIINIRDNPQSSIYKPPLPIFSFSKSYTVHYDIMYPAWTFWMGGPAIATEPTGLGRWDIKREIISKSGDLWPWELKTEKAFFRGSRTSSERDPVVFLSRRRPQLVDAAYTKNQAWKSDKDTLGAAAADIVPLEEHCQYKYLINFRGVAASFRFKHLFLCKSLVFHVGNNWLEFFYPALKPWIHYIPVSQGLENLEDLLEFFQAHDDLAQEIAQRGFRLVWEHLTMKTVKCYWKELLLDYASIINWTVHYDQSLVAIK